MIKLLVTDMDGTCLNSRKEISPKNKAAIRNLIDNGVMVALATGRLDRAIRVYARALDLTLPIISCNGALVRDMTNGDVIFEAPLEQALCLKALEICRGMKAVVHLSCEQDLIITQQMYPRLQLLSDWNDTLAPEHQFKLQIVPDILAPVLDGIKVYKIIAWSQEPGFLTELQAKLHEQPGIEAVQSEDVLLDIGLGGIDKGFAVKKLAQELHLHPSEIMAIGDHDNDLSMIQFAGLGVAMGNASPNLLEAADYITAANDEDGLAQAIEKFIVVI